MCKYKFIIVLQEKQFGCDTCGKKFTHKKDVTNHIKAEHEAASHACDCGKKYKYEQDLRWHKKVEHDNQRFVCAHCNKAYKYKSALNKHAKTH